MRDRISGPKPNKRLRPNQPKGNRSIILTPDPPEIQLGGESQAQEPNNDHS